MKKDTVGASAQKENKFVALLKKLPHLKRGIAFMVCGVLALAVLVTSIVLCAIMPQSRALESGNSTRTVTASQYDGSLYSSDDKGVLYRLDEEGKKLYSYSASEEGATSYFNKIYTHKNMDYLFCVNTQKFVTVLRDTGEGFELVCKSTATVPLTQVIADRDYIYLLKESGRSLLLEKYDKDVFKEGFPVRTQAIASGILYEVSVRSGEITLSEAISPKPVGYVIEDGYLYVFCAAGRIFKISTELDGLQRVNEYMQDARNGQASVPEKDFDKEKYFVYGSTLSICSAEYYYDSGTIYLLDTYANIYACKGKDFNYAASERGVLSFDEGLCKKISFKPGYGPIDQNNANSTSLGTPATYLHQQSGNLLVFFTSSDRVCGFNVADGFSQVFDASFVYNVRAVAYSATEENLFLLYSNADNTAFSLTVSSSDIYSRTTYRVLMIVGFCLAAALLFVCAVLLWSIIKRGGEETLKAFFKDLVKQKWVYLILLVSISALVLFCYYPAVSSILLSFTNYTGTNPTKQWNNFKNYIAIFTDKDALNSLKVMIIFLVVDIITSIAPPMLFAFFLSIMRSKRYSKAARILLFLPSILPSMATTLIWKFGIFGSNGVMTALARFVTGDKTLQISWLFSDKWSLPSLIFMGFPWVGSYLIFYGAMMNIPSSYMEAAELEGCSLIRRFFTIDIPLITSQIKYVFVLAFIASVQNFGRVYATTDGNFGTNVPINKMYHYLLDSNYGMAAAYATILFLFLLVATIFNLRLQTVEQD